MLIIISTFPSKSFLSNQTDIETKQNDHKRPKTYLWTVSLNFSSSKNCKIKNTNSLLNEDIVPGTSNRSSANIQYQTKPPKLTVTNVRFPQITVQIENLSVKLRKTVYPETISSSTLIYCFKLFLKSLLK